MIDMHIHARQPNLPGSLEFAPILQETTDKLAAVLHAEMAAAKIDTVLAMGVLNDDPTDPLGIASTLELKTAIPGLYCIGVADPRCTDDAHMHAVEEELRKGKVVALKAYLGYLHFGPDAPEYEPYYVLAAQYHLPFIFHTGDNYSTTAKVRYAHPLLVDEVAVDHRNVNFVMAHFGNPWIADAAEVIYKNPNVWADLSGLFVSGREKLTSKQSQDSLNDIIASIQRGMRYTEKPDRFLYGTDWPLAPMKEYFTFAERLVPTEFHSLFFRENAQGLFPLISQ